MGEDGASRWGDERAASPLTVIAVVAALAIVLTVLAVFLVQGPPRPTLDVQQAGGAGGAGGFVVAGVTGGLDWDGLSVQLIDRGGSDVADHYLRVPQGLVEEGQVLPLRHMPPAGAYVFRVLDGEAELVRLTVDY